MIQNIEKKLKSNLSIEQLAAFAGVKWLYYGGRRTGRTYLICVIAVLEAIKKVNTEITIIDHFPNPYSYQYLRIEVENIINELNYESEKTQYEFELRKINEKMLKIKCVNIIYLK